MKINEVQTIRIDKMRHGVLGYLDEEVLAEFSPEE